MLIESKTILEGQHNFHNKLEIEADDVEERFEDSNGVINI